MSIRSEAGGKNHSGRVSVGIPFVRRGRKLLTSVYNDAEDNTVQLKFQLALCTSLGTFRKAVS